MDDIRKAELEVRFEQIEDQIQWKKTWLDQKRTEVENTENEIEALQILQRKVNDELGGVSWQTVVD